MTRAPAVGRELIERPLKGKLQARGAYCCAGGFFVVHGFMIEGEPRIGQIATGDCGFQARVHGFDHIRSAVGEIDLALLFLPPACDQAVASIALRLSGGEISLTESLTL